jgi:hypothetical protein
MNCGNKAPITSWASDTGQLSLTVPRGSLCTWAMASPAASAASRIA